jgi:hypothetical protein|tara:strand:- start:42 stop:380 length:339 start_codon:yes stop_codon:yes gene_type:complete
MANFMKFKVDANKDLHLNVENVYRVGLAANDPTDADVLFYYNVASAAGTNVWAVNVKLASAITQLQANQLESLVRKINKKPGGVINASDILGDSLFLAAAAPFAVASTAQPS